MIDGKGLLCGSHGEQFSLNPKANVDIVTKLDGTHMVWRNQVESVKRVIAFLSLVKVGTFLDRSYCFWKFWELVLVCDLSLLSNWDHSIGCLHPYFTVVSDVETGTFHFLGAVASSRV